MEKKKLLLIFIVLLIVVAISAISRFKNVDSINIKTEDVSVTDSQRAREKLLIYPKAKELVGISGYINTDGKNITIGENIGKKVILVDFWTYSCINCQRTLPYINMWWEKYRDDGLLIIGVHTPEFEFEKDYNNVQKAIEKYRVEYPVVQDNDYGTWNSYGNRYWPRKYLIDIDGFVVYDHIGEGAYDETEKKIQTALKERASVLRLNENIEEDISKPNADNVIASKIGSPEIYFGVLFSRKQFGNPEGWQAGQEFNYEYPVKFEDNKFYLDGKWKTNPDNMELVGDSGRIHLIYTAKQVNLVAGSEQPIKLTIYVDGIKHKEIMIENFDLYNIVGMDDYGRHELEIEVSKPGLMAYTFTFG